MGTKMNYTDEQQTAINKAINERLPYCSYDWSDWIVNRGNEKFAIFGSIARKLLPFSRVEDGGSICEYMPVIVDGRMLYRVPQEGASGVLYLVRMLQRKGKPIDNPKWYASYTTACGWVYTEELNLGNEEIARNIADEIRQGENVLTIPPAGWA